MQKDSERTGRWSVFMRLLLAALLLAAVWAGSGRIVRADETEEKISISSAQVTLSKTSVVYSGNERKPKTTVTLTVNGKTRTLEKGTDYTVSYTDNIKIGTAKVTIKGIGDYTGKVKATFEIRPAKVELKSVTSKSTGKITVKWSKVEGGVKYQIAYRIKGTSTWKKIKVSSSSVKKTISSLTRGSKYQVKVRAYKKVSGKTYYGKWSETKAKTCMAGVVYLTIDDGPTAYMEDMLDVLDEYDVKATFFVTGNGSAYRDLITEAYERGHGIALHSYTHDYSKIYKSTSAFFKDMKKVQKLVKSLTGETVWLIRFPGGSSNTISRHYKKGIMTTLSAAVEEKGYTYFDWNVSADDASTTVTTKQVIKNATSGSAASSKEIVLLMHCTYQHCVDALPSIIKYYQKKGYVFEVLTEDSYTAHHPINN